MITAYLTIDDVCTKNTPAIIDYLNAKNIKPIMFCWGQQIEKYRENAIYALKQGAILQNHSYSHPAFSSLTFEQGVEEIIKNEQLLQSIYAEAKVNRPYKLFRFPYGDKGGNNTQRFQNWLKNNGFSHIDDTVFSKDAYILAGGPADQKDMYDVLWTFDFAEYMMHSNKDFTFLNVTDNINKFVDRASKDMNMLSSIDNNEKHTLLSKNIVLIHDHELSNELHPGYFAEQIDMLIDRGVIFIPPAIQ